MNNDIWYCIPGYNGYEYNEDGLVRSMKFFNIYPHGQLLKSHSDKVGSFYYMSNNQNERKKVYIDEIEKLIASNIKTIRNWNDNDIASRNIVTRKPVNKKGKKEEIYYPKFRIRKNAIRFY